uniref:Ig-like domain-containing protein n=1 Tax=Ditylenchus dipsaci TaxID=166011 RepID=A0A915CRC7_9BILA
MDSKTSITWLFNNSNVLPSNSKSSALGSSTSDNRLFITEAGKHNHGLYSCLVRNSIGESSKTFNLTVLVPPKFASETYEENVKVIVEHLHELSCPVGEGNPEPHIQWLIDGHPINGDQLEKPSADQPTPTTISKLDSEGNVQAKSSVLAEGKKLAIIGSEAARFRYTCVLKNEAGTVSRDYFVQVGYFC